jgi:glycogen debranching enzyme
MDDPTARFFDDLAGRRREPRLENVSGTLRFDIDGEHGVDRWFVEIRDGDLTVSREDREPDALIRTDRTLFGRIVTGEANSVAEWVRGRLKIQGSLPLLRLFERLFPGLPDARDPRQMTRARASAGPGAAIAGEGSVGTVDGRVSILDGSIFLVTDGRGDIDSTTNSPIGLFAFDTRFLSLWHLSINGQRVHALSVDDLQYYETRYFLVPGTPSHDVNTKLSVIRRHSLSRSLVEELTVVNHQDEPVDVHVRVDMGSDFADSSEVRHMRGKSGKCLARVDNECLRLGYQREDFYRETVVSSSQSPQVDEAGMTFNVRIPPHEDWSTVLHVATLGGDGRDIRTVLQGTPSRLKEDLRQDLDDWLDRAPTLRCDWEILSQSYQRSLVDLAALQYRVLGLHTHLPAAGLPWFMCVFGRDSILSSLQALPFAPELAATTLLLLGAQRGKRLDDFRDEEPGKIWQEARLGEAAAFEDRPHSPSFDAADVTPLWLILLDEYERWTGDAALVRRLEPEARMCLAWIDTYADALGNGYIWFQSRNGGNSSGNQCWKNSWDSISSADGTLPDFPRATCELQGYAYDAKVRAARLARTIWNDPAYADQLEREAADLNARFNRDFWIEDKQYYALALDPDGRQVDALASNIGHLLWSGIVPPDRATCLARHLTAPKLFSGWGVRTLATDAQRYNPLGYHTGAVWPFDNSLIVWGLRRYGFAEEAARIAQAMIDASQYFHNRLPEALAGYDRTQTKYPVEYPSACSPHAVSAGAVLLILRALLGLDPRGEHLKIEPALPTSVGRLQLLDIPGRWGHIDAFGRGRIDLDTRQPADKRG